MQESSFEGVGGIKIATRSWMICSASGFHAPSAGDWRYDVTPPNRLVSSPFTRSKTCAGTGDPSGFSRGRNSSTTNIA